MLIYFCFSGQDCMTMYELPVIQIPEQKEQAENVEDI